MEHSFQVGDQVRLYINKDRMQGEGKKLKPIRYGPFRILEKVGENDFRLDLPTYMHIYSVVNADFLRLFEPSMIEDPEEQSQLPYIDDLLPEYLNELQEDTVLEKKVRTTCSGQVEYLRIGFKGSKLSSSKLSSAKWIEIGQGTPSIAAKGESTQAGEEPNRHRDRMVKAMNKDIQKGGFGEESKQPRETVNSEP
eukprot:PITA_05183